MGNLGGGEILVLLLVGLMVLGPERLPAVVRQMGKALRQVRTVTAGFQEELRSAVEDPIADVKASLDTAGFQEGLRSAVEDPIADLKASLDTAGFQEELRSAVEDPIADVKASLDTAGFQEELRSAVEDPIADVKASLDGETSLRSAPGTGVPKPGSENPQAGPEKSEDQATESETDGD
ncbi:MAG TPA: Sec-independent protein translocase protein TatB [Acidimicrobiales bacterium]|jgi:Tat protein translocase TatB subunit|nr:Sec-independent protein translocase protein TatB [Acidimicrobiales bacterium]